MTDLVQAPTTPLTVRDVAVAAAAAAAVEIREITDVVELEDIERLWSATWYPGTDQTPVTRDMMRAMTHAGAYLGAAFDGPRLVGAGFGFFGTPGNRHLHSHLAAVTPDARSRNVGLALKAHQRAWAAKHGATTITWTFDPLVRRNAHFNVAKLGAIATEYYTDFYGAMQGINVGQGSDRLLMTWSTQDPVAPAAGPLDRPSGERLLDIDASGRPVVTRARETGAASLVGVPADIEEIRLSDPALARSWRSAMRDVLGGLLSDGQRVTGFTRDGSYVVEAQA
ncbi:MAG: GNAT family N-acetyltransferase [Nocardioides sp.]